MTFDMAADGYDQFIGRYSTLIAADGAKSSIARSLRRANALIEEYDRLSA